MNFVGTTTYQGTKKDADELYNMFKDDLAKCTSSFEWAHIREGKMIFIANVTDEEKFYALFEDQRSKDWNAKFNVVLVQKSPKNLKHNIQNILYDNL